MAFIAHIERCGGYTDTHTIEGSLIENCPTDRDRIVCCFRLPVLNSTASFSSTLTGTIHLAYIPSGTFCLAVIGEILAFILSFTSSRDLYN
jgi:hypothetical protein